MKMLKLQIFFVFVVLVFASCTKSGLCPDSQIATLDSSPEWGGCGWKIILKDGKKLKPTNLSDFDLTLEHGLKIKLSHHEIPQMSFCNVATVIEIDCIKER